MFRKNDPITSKQAADKVDFKAKHYDQILAVLVLNGPQALACKQSEICMSITIYKEPA